MFLIQSSENLFLVLYDGWYTFYRQRGDGINRSWGGNGMHGDNQSCAYISFSLLYHSLYMISLT